jgi:hypothetical protein
MYKRTKYSLHGAEQANHQNSRAAAGIVIPAGKVNLLIAIEL